MSGPFSLLYDSLLTLYGLVQLPLNYKKKGMGTFRRRFFWNFPELKTDGRQVVWIHAVSLGEAKAAAPLAKLLKAQLGKECFFVVSSVTETGHEEAQKSLPFADAHVYLPLDLSWNIKRSLKKISPSLVILTEGDIWYQFLHHCKKKGAKVAVVNGKLSERSCSRLRFFSPVAHKLYGLIDKFLVQNELYKERFTQIGIEEDKLAVTGNIKFDLTYPYRNKEELAVWKQRLGLNAQDLVLTLGSTHHPEEEQLLDALTPVWEKFPNLKVLLVPRHPQRFEEVAGLLKAKRIPFSKYSEGRFHGKEKVLLIDAMGILPTCYQLSDLALVCGSYTDKIGGHNILEPCAYGVPALFGPHMFTQPELKTLVLDAQAGEEIPLEKIAERLIALFSQKEIRKAMGERGQKLTKELRGACPRTVDALISFLNLNVSGIKLSLPD